MSTTALSTHKRNGHSPILDAAGRPFPGMRRRAGMQLESMLEAAGTDRTNRHHWGQIDGANLNAELGSDLETIRGRCRHEWLNGGYVNGLVGCYVDDIVGELGPVLQITAEGRGADSFAAEIEREWEAWCAVCDASSDDALPDVLRMELKWWLWAGEFANQLIDGDEDGGGGPVRLRLLPVAPERLVTPTGETGNDDIINGVRVNRHGKPREYYVLDKHPGSWNALGLAGSGEWVPARDLWNVFERDEAGQVRGMPRLAPVIQVWGQIRGFTDDTLLAARMAAMLAGFIHTTHQDAEFDDMKKELPIFDLEPATLTTLPAGWEFSQSRPTHPSATYDSFIDQKLTEGGRPLGMPKLRSKGTAEKHNFASARLDMNVYWGGIKARRRYLGRRFLTRLFNRWWAEYRLVTGKRPPRVWKPTFVWGPAPQVDEFKESKAADTRLGSGVSSLRDECALLGRDVADVIRQRGVERKLLIAAGLLEEKPKTQSPKPKAGDSQ